MISTSVSNVTTSRPRALVPLVLTRSTEPGMLRRVSDWRKMRAGWSGVTSGASPSGTRQRTCIFDMSEITMIRVPRLFIVPVMTTSPCSAKSWEITPLIGAWITVLSRSLLGGLQRGLGGDQLLPAHLDHGLGPHDQRAVVVQLDFGGLVVLKQLDHAFVVAAGLLEVRAGLDDQCLEAGDVGFG